MAAKYLGTEFDIHGGGLDLRFPHHENELAQSRAAGQKFARLWMHNAMLNLGSSKMSKSVGNTLMVSEVVKRVPPIALRYYLLAAHYRSIIEYSEEALAEAATTMARITGFVKRADEVTGGQVSADGVLRPDFIEAMDDDLAVPAALAALQAAIAEGNKLLADGDSSGLRENLASVRAMLEVLGIDPLDDVWSSAEGSSAAESALDSLIRRLLDARAEARAAKDFETADRVRDQLTESGIVIEDTPQGARWTLPEDR